MFSTSFFAQEIGVNRNKISAHKIDESSLIFDKVTGEKISFDESKRLVEAHPNFSFLIKEEDVYGNPLSYYFIKDRFEIDLSNVGISTVEIERLDINDNLFNLKNINSEITLIILQMDLELQYINLDNIKEAELAALSRGLTSVILTTTDAKMSKVFTKTHDLKSIVIPNAKNAMDKFRTKRFPMYYLLNADKDIIFNFKYSYEVEDQLKKMD